MELAREDLTVLLNALYDSGTTSVTVAHPSDAVGDLLTVELGAPRESSIRVHRDDERYADARRAVERDYGSPAVDELPTVQSYHNAFLAGGLLEPANLADITDFLDRHGSPDLSAGHEPVVAGFDTNLVPWRIAAVLDLRPGDTELVNGFALATGVRDELDWDYKRDDTRPLEEAFGPAFERLWNQPAGANREGRLGENYYRRLRDHRYADEIPSGSGDDDIVTAYDEYEQESRKAVLLFSNDRDFVERARAHRVLAHRVEFPATIPSQLTGSWADVIDTLYVLTVLFGVLELPKVTLYGVWQGKGGQAWHDERLEIDCRSPVVAAQLERDRRILDEFEEGR